MGAKYTSTTPSGYNSSPPPDDGSTGASNLITWSGIKTKLGDPLNTFASAINSALVAALNTSVRQISAADSSVAGDHLRTIEIAPTVSNTVTVSLGDAATMTTTYLLAVRNSSTISQVISRATAGDKIDGVAGNITIPAFSSILFTTNSVPDGYLSLARFGPIVDSDPIVVGSSDGTKKVRLEVDGLTTGTTRVITVPDADITLGLGSTAAQTFLGSDVSLNNTANYFNVVNTGSIGASGQKWKITASALVDDTAGSAALHVRIWDGTTVYADTKITTSTANDPKQVTIAAIVTLSGATTFHLSAKDASTTSGFVRTTGGAGTANKASWIIAERIT